MLVAGGIAITIALACAGLGSVVLRLSKIQNLAPIERVSLGLGLGFGCLAVVLFGAGICGLLTRITFAFLLLPAVLEGVFAVRQRRLHKNDWQLMRWFLDLSVIGRLLIVLFVLCATANVMGALTPPNFIDALIYHLYVPQQFLRAQAIVELSGIWQHYQPMASELLYMVALAFDSPKGASLLCAVMGLLAASGTFLLGRRLAGPLAGTLATVIFYNNAMMAWESTSCFVDLAVAALGTLGFLALIHWADSRRRAWLVVAALLMGFAASCKLNAGAFVLVAAVIVAALSVQAGERAYLALSRLLAFGLVASLPVLPWLIRSWVLTGNPLYPFATPLFGGNADRAAIDWVFAHYGVGYSFADRVLAPWHLFTQGGAFENGNYLSPLPMLMAPVIALRAWREGGPRVLLLAAAVGLLALWSAGAHVARYVLPIEPLLCVLAADALCWLGSFRGRRQAMAVLCGGAFLLFGTASTLLYDKQFVPVAFGRESESRYLQRTTWYYDAFREVCAGLPPGGRVLTNSQKPTFYLDCPQGRANDHDFDDLPRLRRIISEGHYTDVLVMGNESLEAKVASLGSMVQLVWQRTVDLLVSRTFGRTAKHSVAWYRVKVE